MRKLFKYLFLLLVAAVFWNGKGLSMSSVPDDVHVNVPFQETICSAELSEVDSEPCLPRQITFSTTFRIQGAAKRINNTGGIATDNPSCVSQINRVYSFIVYIPHFN